MKVIDNREKSNENVKKAPWQIADEKREARRKQEELKKSNTLSLQLDWRTHGELDPLMPNPMPIQVINATVRNFVDSAIRDYKNVEEIILEKFGEPQWNAEKHKVELTAEEMKDFQKAAKRAGVSQEEFAVALVYTKAKKLNDEKKARQEVLEKEKYDNYQYSVDDVKIPRKLFDKLRDEYQEEIPQEFKGSVVGNARINEWIEKALNDYYLK